MRRFQRILVVPVTDRSEPPAALHEALSLAKSSGAQVRVLGHLPEVPESERQLDNPQQVQLRMAATGAYTERLRGWAAALDAPDLLVDVASGSQPRAVASFVKRFDHDLVVIARDDSGESAAAARRIVRTAPCPVWLLQPDYTGLRVLAAIDPDHDPDQNRLILQLANSQAEMHNGHLRVMHAWDIPNFDMAKEGGLELERSRLADLSVAIETAHRTPFEKVVADAGLDTGSNLHLVDGPPARAIRGLAVLHRADLVVLGAGAWSEPELGVGSTTEQVIAEVGCSLLIVRHGLDADPGAPSD